MKWPVLLEIQSPEELQKWNKGQFMTHQIDLFNKLPLLAISDNDSMYVVWHFNYNQLKLK